MAAVVQGTTKNPLLSNSVTGEDHFLQYVPAKIDHNDKANVRQFFVDNICGENKSQLTAAFRGRPLNGKVHQLKQHRAVVMQVKNQQNQMKVDTKDDNDDEMNGNGQVNTTVFRTQANCNKVTIWNYDKPSDKGDDPLSRGLLYANLASILHK